MATDGSAAAAGRTGRNLDIDRLRAVAILLVMVSHLPLLLPTAHTWDRLVSRLWVGVDLFFCISGFVVAGVLLPKLDRALGSPGRRGAVAAELKVFFIRRAFRILPLSWLWLALTIAAAFAWNRSGAFGSAQTAVDAVPSILTYWNNLWGAWQLAAILDAPTPISVYWSLSLEEQFYLLFPLLMVVVVSPRWRWAALVALVVIQQPLARPVWSLAWVLRSDALALGVLIYLFSRTAAYPGLDPKFLRRDVAKWVIIGTLGVVTVLVLTVPVRYSATIAHFPGMVGVIALASAALVFVASYDRDYVLAWPLLRNVLDWIGTRSYGLYLAHLPAFMAAREAWFRIAHSREDAFGDSYAVPVVVTGILVLVVVTEVLYRGFEAPLRRYGRSIARRCDAAARETRPAD